MTLQMLKAQLAPYLPPGSDKESIFFRATDRDYLEKVAKMSRKGVVDVNYDPRMTLVREKV